MQVAAIPGLESAEIMADEQRITRPDAAAANRCRTNAVV